MLQGDIHISEKVPVQDHNHRKEQQNVQIQDFYLQHAINKKQFNNIKIKTENRYHTFISSSAITIPG